VGVINNLQQFHSAIAAVCPIVGVGGDGTIFYDPAATAAQKAAAVVAANGYSDVPPQVIDITLAVGRMTDAEYTALHTFASTHPALHRVLNYIRTIDLTQTNVQNLIAALVTAGILTQARADVVFVAPPPMPNPPTQSPPQPTPIAT